MKFQGKTQKQYEDSARFVGYSIIGMIAFSSCATTKVDKCCKNSDKIIEHYETK